MNQESDRHIHIPFLQALYATGVGGEGGPQGADDDKDLFGFEELSDPDFAKYNTSKALVTTQLVAQVPGFSTTFTALPTAVGDVRALRGAAAAGFVAVCVANGIWVPAEIVIARPFIEHLMMSAIVTVAGRDTGATLFGPADMRTRDHSAPLSLHTGMSRTSLR